MREILRERHLWMRRDYWEQAISFLLPKWLVYFATIRCAAYATVIYHDKTPDEISVFEMLKVWDSQ